MAGSLTRGRTVVETRASHGAFNASYASDCNAVAVRDAVLNAIAIEAAK